MPEQINEAPACALPVAVDRQLLNVLGVAPTHASKSDLMRAVAQLAREQLSRRWVATDAADRADKARRVEHPMSARRRQRSQD